jgi:hypothetical protein
LVCEYHHHNFERLGWVITMPDGIPTWIPPTWRDPEQKPIRNHTHHQPIYFRPIEFDAIEFDAPADGADCTTDVRAGDNVNAPDPP